MKLGLVMIVRDEQTLPMLLDQAMPLVDTATIVDTGSTDDTPNIAAGYGATVHRRDWVSFAHNRTEALQLAQGTADYHLMLDADHRIETHGERPETLTADSYMIRIRSAGDEWRLPLLTRDGVPFRYQGAAHAYLTGGATTDNLDWLTVHGGKGATPEKLERDRVLLEQAFLDNPGDARTCFYLAQTYRDLNMPQEAIRFYRLRVSMNGWDEERYWARYQLGCLLAEHVEGLEGARELVQAWQDRPHRAEALRALARVADRVADKLPKPDDSLFVRASDYRSAA